MKYKTKKAPKTPVQKAIDLADKWMSYFIRLSYANDDGVVRCSTCGLWKEWKYIQNGHWIPRQYFSTRYEETNCAPQCGRCNGFEGGRMDAMEKHIKKKWGEETILMLTSKKRNRFDKSEWVFKIIAEEYRKKAQALPNAYLLKAA